MKEKLSDLWCESTIFRIIVKVYAVWIALSLTAMAFVFSVEGKDVFFETLGTSSVPLIILAIIVAPFVIIAFCIYKLWEMRSAILPAILFAAAAFAVLGLIMKVWSLFFPDKGWGDLFTLDVLMDWNIFGPSKH